MITNNDQLGMEMIHTLSHGVIIHDNRDFGLGLLINDLDFKYLSLGYLTTSNDKLDFFVRRRARTATELDVLLLCDEANKMQEVLCDANHAINGDVK